MRLEDLYAKYDTIVGAGGFNVTPVEHFVFDNTAVEKQHTGNDGNEKDDQVANTLDLVTVLALNIVLILFQNLAAVGVPPRYKLLFGHICRYIPRAL